MTKLVQALIARILAATTDAEWNGLCGDIETLFQQEKINAGTSEMLFRLINRLHQ